MDLARILNQGVGSWLHFESACNRSGLFNEKYLSYPIGLLLSARFPERVFAEFVHPILSPAMTGRGRRPQVDFAYCDPYPLVKVAVETKWVGKRRVSIDEIIWDLIRLELISFNSGAECFFMIGGRRKRLEALFQSENFSGSTKEPKRRPILDFNRNEMTSLWITAKDHYRIPLLRKVFEGAPDLIYPQRIITRRTNPFPHQCKMGGFQVYTWKIAAAQQRDTFRAKQSRHFR